MKPERVFPTCTFKVMEALGITFATKKLGCVSMEILRHAQRDQLVSSVIEARAVELMADDLGWRRVVAERKAM